MSFSPEIFNKKLASLQDTQDSIVTISQWVLFHHRHSKDSARLWLEFILNPSNNSAKKLSLLYLCNDVVQQAKHKRKSEFITEFAKILPTVLNKIYVSLDASIKAKVDRLVNVWEQRAVFASSDIKEMKRAIELSKTNKPIDSETEAAPAANNKPKETIVPELRHLNNLLLHLNQLVEVSQANLNQVGIQSKTYLPQDPSSSDNLPSPKIYISKLNILEKLCNISNNNIDEIKKDRNEILKQLDNLRSIIHEGLKTDDTKISIINSKLSRLNTTRQELQGILTEYDSSSSASTQPVPQEESEEPSPTFDNDDDNDDDFVVPSYENDDIDNEEPPSKRSRPSPNPSTASSTPNSVKKSVAFSEDIEIKEYEREEQTEIIKCGDENYDIDLDLEEEQNISLEFQRHHKDDLELKHEHDSADDNDDGYDPSSGLEDNDSENNNNGDNSTMDNNVLNLLSKLA